MLRVNFEDPDLEYMGIDAGGGNMYNYQNVPFTGILEEFYANGNLIGKIEIRNGYTYGLQDQYYENGQIQREYFLKFNHFYGSYKCWDIDGNLTLHVEHDDDGNILNRIIG